MKKYKEAENILREVKKATKILLVLHKSPDPDSVASNLAMYEFLKGLEKKVEVVSVDRPPDNLAYLPSANKIQTEDLFDKDLSTFDLFIALDTAATHRLTEKTAVSFPARLFVINIDHHYLNDNFGAINLVDAKTGSLGEILYNLFSDWGVEVTPSIATCLMTGIAGDTGTFRFASGVSPDTFKAASDLLQKGATFPDIAFNLNQRISLATAKFWAVVLGSMKIEKAGGYCFIWVAIPFSQLEEFGGPAVNKDIPETFLANIEGTDFGIFLAEEEKGVVKVSMRSRTGVNVALIAKEFGGGGHKVAAGFRVYGEFGEATKKIKETLERYLEQHEK